MLFVPSAAKVKIFVLISNERVKFYESEINCQAGIIINIDHFIKN